EINGLLVGFDAEKDGRYVLDFALSDDYAEGAVFIHDLHTDMKQRVVNGSSYPFEAKRGDTGARFRLSYVEGADDELAQIQVGTVANRIVITNNTSHDYQASVYATDGKLLQRINVPAGSEMKSDPMIAGGYVVNLQSPTTNGSAKKVVIN
ncbi:T9SS type A sorting domain-containing protein, partial [Porphyromonas loveana]|uniref:T9SS type A sorting domain-containing protein n=1 Tax=Porphyromonas loveana TaxID=1884669 RepID=UPI00359FDD8B